ncbi:FldB/FldC dehydratase alpha/beta subunit [Acididesulfobacillus acetoxydans]|uniref:Benzoyl CoA reductase subunit n=1 Tax=Acididesulfobacillus acetoxydans TaxID=1561005 RepID=A0A8S0WFJ8_9FIRM|nr:benzoyl-CoA reductase, bzd-type, subunit N [Acididesulfobacillus acetoxydans]CAA7601112.1 FldB/FldC dehydratase alpha/beta subunit [Acididesulfobacillus acetoxydans]CEJ07141.1 Benzoyl CoA reductase subunit [Acididesulfobacillus acetoxydans]
MFTQFKQWYTNRHDYARDWKERSGSKVIGYFCTYVPEEILYAANVLPVRILGGHEPQDVTEPHIFGMYCPFSRDVLAQGLKDRFSYLDGITIAQSCLHIRQAYTSWDLHRPTEFSYYLPMPHNVQSAHSRTFLRAELEQFKEAVEQWTGQTITDADLDRGIDIVNTNRRLLKRIFELRRQENPPLSGQEAMYLVLSSQMTDKREHNQALEKLLEQLPERELKRPTGERLMILGSENDDIPFTEMVEQVCGATFVIDDHCTGTRYFWNESVPNEDRLLEIANRYVDRVPCPTKDWPQRKRLEHIQKLIEDYDVQGVIVIQQKFCDPHELDIPAIQKVLKGKGIPTLFLEFDVTAPLGPFRIRVEAFLEMMRQEDLF